MEKGGTDLIMAAQFWRNFININYNKYCPLLMLQIICGQRSCPVRQLLQIFQSIVNQIVGITQPATTQTICSGTSASFNGSDRNRVSYQWKRNY
jgi:hypothetical protein